MLTSFFFYSQPKVSEEEMELATETMEMIGNIKTCLVNLHLHAREMNSPFAQEVLRRPRLNWMADVIQVMEGDIQQYLGNQAETTKNQPETPEAKDDETLEEPSERATSPSRTEIPVMVPSPSMTEILLDALERQKDKKSPLQKPMTCVKNRAKKLLSQIPKLANKRWETKQTSPPSALPSNFVNLPLLAGLNVSFSMALSSPCDASSAENSANGRTPTERTRRSLDGSLSVRIAPAPPQPGKSEENAPWASESSAPTSFCTARSTPTRT